MSACTACKWISSLPVFWRNAFIKGPEVKHCDWTMGDLAHGAGAWLGIVGCSDQASDSGILWLSIAHLPIGALDRGFCFALNHRWDGPSKR